MEKLDNLYQRLQEKGIYFFDLRLPFSNAATKAVTIHLPDCDAWGIFLDRSRMESTAEEHTALLHESGHCFSGSTHALGASPELVQSHESRADRWAMQQAVSAEALKRAVDAGHTELGELARQFGITEDLMRKAVRWYAADGVNQ